MLLYIDGLYYGWEGDLGECAGADVSSHIPVNILQRMRDNNQPMRSFDMSRMQGVEDRYSQEKNSKLTYFGVITDDTDTTVCVVNELNRDFFCKKLA